VWQALRRSNRKAAGDSAGAETPAAPAPTPPQPAQETANEAPATAEPPAPS
jgi:hypothetical protein